MTPVDMTVRHDPANGSYGDSFRCCVASLLDMSVEQIPHFSEGNQSELEVRDVMDHLFYFLRDLALYPIAVRIHVSIDDSWLDAMRGNYIISGIDADGGPHAVIGIGRRALVHDPNPNYLKKSMVKPIPGGGGSMDYFWVYMFLKLL